MDVFISHAHENRRLAEAWQRLLRSVSGGRIDPWYSSDPRAEGGVGPGNWRDKVRARIAAAEAMLILITPGSNQRPWLVWEGGFASGQAKTVVPITYFVQARSIHSVFQNELCYSGEDEQKVTELCARLVAKLDGAAVPPEAVQSWRSFVDEYTAALLQEREESLSKRLFDDHFHQKERAEQMEGVWFAKWTRLNPDGTESVFELDTLQVWTNESRLRVVGINTKRNLDAVKDAKYYPMEGVVSWSGWVALSYWSGGAIPICGTCLLRPRGASGNLFEGTWQGYTAPDFQDDPAFAQGRVVMARNRETVVAHWGLVPADGGAP
jgi:hypothetical protein